MRPTEGLLKRNIHHIGDHTMKLIVTLFIIASIALYAAANNAADVKGKLAARHYQIATIAD